MYHYTILQTLQGPQRLNISLYSLPNSLYINVSTRSSTNVSSIWERSFTMGWICPAQVETTGNSFVFEADGDWLTKWTHGLCENPHTGFLEDLVTNASTSPGVQVVANFSWSSGICLFAKLWPWIRLETKNKEKIKNQCSNVKLTVCEQLLTYTNCI